MSFVFAKNGKFYWVLDHLQILYSASGSLKSSLRQCQVKIVRFSILEFQIEVSLTKKVLSWQQMGTT